MIDFGLFGIPCQAFFLNIRLLYSLSRDEKEVKKNLDCSMCDMYRVSKKWKGGKIVMSKLRNLTKSRKFYLLLCGVMLLSLFVKAPVANSAPPLGIAIETFTKIDFVNNICWKLSVGSGHIQYTNACNFSSDVVLTHLDGITLETFTVAPNGKLIFLGGSVVHIFRELP